MKKKNKVYYDANVIVSNWRTCKYGQAGPQAAKNLEALSSGNIKIRARNRVWNFSKEIDKIGLETLTVPIRIVSPSSDVENTSEDWTTDGSAIVEYGFGSIIKWIPMICLFDSGNVIPAFTIELDLDNVYVVIRCTVVTVSKDVQKKSFANIYLPFIDDKMNVIPEHQLSFEDDKNEVDFDGGILIGEDKNLFRHELEEEFEEEDMNEQEDFYTINAGLTTEPNVSEENENTFAREVESAVKQIVEEETDDFVKEINKIHESQGKQLSTAAKIGIGVGIAIGIGGIAGICYLVKKELDKHK